MGSLIDFCKLNIPFLSRLAVSGTVFSGTAYSPNLSPSINTMALLKSDSVGPLFSPPFSPSFLTSGVTLSMRWLFIWRFKLNKNNKSSDTLVLFQVFNRQLTTIWDIADTEHFLYQRKFYWKVLLLEWAPLLPLSLPWKVSFLSLSLSLPNPYFFFFNWSAKFFVRT